MTSVELVACTAGKIRAATALSHSWFSVIAHATFDSHFLSNMAILARFIFQFTAEAACTWLMSVQLPLLL